MAPKIIIVSRKRIQICRNTVVVAPTMTHALFFEKYANDKLRISIH